MPLKFNKENLLLVLLTVAANKDSGRFVSELLRFAEEKRKAKKGGNLIGGLSRTGLYNYLKEIESKASIFDSDDRQEIAQTYCDQHPQEASKYYKKFNKSLFDAYVLFLQRHGYLEHETYISDVARIDDHAYFSTLSFLGATIEQQVKMKSRLLGEYRVFRPSLQAPDQILVSCAQFYETNKHAIAYRELMHYRSSWDGGWRKQIFSGYVVHKKNTFFLTTRDSSTDLIQMSILQVRYSDPDRKIHLLSGSYNGSSDNISEKVFSTGIVMARNDIPSLHDVAIEDWDLRSNQSFGLFDKNDEEIGSAISDYLFSNNYRFRQS